MTLSNELTEALSHEQMAEMSVHAVRTPTSVVDAKSAIRRAKKYIKKAQVERADCVRANYDWGVKAQDEIIAMYVKVVTVMEKWIASNGG